MASLTNVNHFETAQTTLVQEVKGLAEITAKPGQKHDSHTIRLFKDKLAGLEKQLQKLSDGITPLRDAFYSKSSTSMQEFMKFASISGSFHTYEQLTKAMLSDCDRNITKLATNVAQPQ